MLKSLLFFIAFFPVFTQSAEPKVVKVGLNTSTLNIQKITKVKLVEDKENKLWTMELAGYVLTNTSDGNILENNPENLYLTLVPELYAGRSFFKDSIERKYHLALGMTIEADYSKPVNRIVATGGRYFSFTAKLILPQPKKNLTIEMLYQTNILSTKNIDLEWNLENKKWVLSYGPHAETMPKIDKALTVQSYGVPYWDLQIDKIEQVSKESDYLSFKVDGKYAPVTCKDHKVVNELVHYIKFGPEYETTRFILLGLITADDQKVLDPLGFSCNTKSPEKDFQLSTHARTKTSYFRMPVAPFDLRESTMKSVSFPVKSKTEGKVSLIDLHYSLKDKVWKESRFPGEGQQMPLPILD